MLVLKNWNSKVVKFDKKIEWTKCKNNYNNFKEKYHKEALNLILFT